MNTSADCTCRFFFGGIKSECKESEFEPICGAIKCFDPLRIDQQTRKEARAGRVRESSSAGSAELCCSPALCHTAQGLAPIDDCSIMQRSTILRRALLPYGRQPGVDRSVYHLRLCSTSSWNIPPAEPEGVDKEEAGRELAKLAKITGVLREAIQKNAQEVGSPPEILVPLEQDVMEANDLIKTALRKAGEECSVEELAHRIDRNVVAIPVEALDYKDLLRANTLRDSIEEILVSLQVMPPADTMLAGTGKPFSRLDRKELRRRQEEEESGKPQVATVTTRSVEEEGAPTELRPPSEEERALRKAHLENATSMEEVLRGFSTALLEVGRVHKVVKGGTTMSMRALVVIGNRNGTAGYGEGKSDTAQHAIERACRDAKRNLLCIDLHQDRTIFHRAKGRYVKSQVTLWPAPRGTGISANNNFSAIFQLFGLKDIGAKLHGPRTLSNAVKALFNALSHVNTPEGIARARGLQEIVRPPPIAHAPGVRRRKLQRL